MAEQPLVRCDGTHFLEIGFGNFELHNYYPEECIVTNPFEDESAMYCVLVNDEGQYSLWPIFLPTPDGWTAAGPAGDRQSCLVWIDTNWTDMRPKSLLAQTDNTPESTAAPHSGGQ